MDNAIEINRASKFYKIVWLKAVCFAAVAGLASTASIFLGSILFETSRPTTFVEAMYTIVLGGVITALCELISCFVHAEMMREVNYIPILLKTTAASFAAFVAAGVVPAAAGIVTHTVAERITVVLVVVLGMLFMLSAIISLAGDISFRKCLVLINLGGTFVACISVALSLLVHKMRVK